MKSVCGFTKVGLAAGETKRVQIAVKLKDLARYGPTFGHGAHAEAYVVDGGEYDFFAANCVANPALRDVHHEGDPTCPYRESAIVGAKGLFGREGAVYGVYV